MRWVVLVALGVLASGCSLILDGDDGGDGDGDDIDAGPMPEEGCATEPNPDDACLSGVCDRLANVCISDASYVDPEGDDSNACTQMRPCATVSRGIAVAAAGSGVVHVAPETYEDTLINYSEDTTVRVLGYDGVQLAGGEGNPIVLMAAGRLIFEGIAFVANPDVGDQPAFNMSDSALELSGVLVETATNDGIRALRADVVVDASVIRNNAGFGVSVANSTLTITSTEIWSNMGGGVVVSAGTTDIALSTILDNGGTSVECNGPASVVGSIVLTATGTPTTCPDAAFSFSHVQGVGNNDFPEPAFVGRGSGDFRLQVDSPGLDVGELQERVNALGLAIDVDGRDRVQNGAPDIGANEGEFK